MSTERTPYRISLRQILVAVAMAAVYLATRRWTITQDDLRYISLLGPCISAICFSVYWAFSKKTLGGALLSAAAGAAIVQAAWLCELPMRTSLIVPFEDLGSWIDFIIVACIGAVLGFGLACPLGIAAYCVATAEKIIGHRSTAAMCVLLVYALLLSITYERWSDASFRYRVLEDKSCLRAALAEEVRDGDPISVLVAAVGPWEHEKSKDWIDTFVATRNSEGELSYPAAYKPGDRFVQYEETVGPGLILQIRNGRLVNYDLAEMEASANPWWR